MLTSNHVFSLSDYYPNEITSVFIENIQVVNLNFCTQMKKNCEIPFF